MTSPTILFRLPRRNGAHKAWSISPRRRLDLIDQTPPVICERTQFGCGELLCAGPCAEDGRAGRLGDQSKQQCSKGNDAAAECHSWRNSFGASQVSWPMGLAAAAAMLATVATGVARTRASGDALALVPTNQCAHRSRELGVAAAALGARRASS